MTRAGRSIQKAVQAWNKYNWRWLMTQVTGNYSSGDDSISLPYDFKDVYTMRVTEGGITRTLVGTPRRLYDRVHPLQTGATDPIQGYDLYTQGASGTISLQNEATADGTYDLKYYRRMWIPCAFSNITCTGGDDVSNLNAIYASGSQLAGVTIGTPVFGYSSEFDPILADRLPIQVTAADTLRSNRLILFLDTNWTAASGSASLTFGGDTMPLDIPEDYENGIMAYATHHFLSGLGSPPGRLSYYIQLANDEFQEARAANERYEDTDQSFEIGPINPYYPY